METPAERERKWWNALRCGDTATSSNAAFALATALCERGREEEAEGILRSFAEATADHIAAPAMIRLAQLIERQEGPVEAELAYEAAARRASAVESPDVLIELAARWATYGEMRRAVEAYTEIVQKSADPHLRAVAGYRLGVLRYDAGLLHSAVLSWEDALEESAPPLRSHLLLKLAEALLEGDVGPVDRTRCLLEEVIETDHPDLAPRAALRLAELKRDQGEVIDAYRLAQLVVDSEHPVFAPEAETERDRLVQSGLNSLLELESREPAANQLGLWEGRHFRRRSERLETPSVLCGLIADGISGTTQEGASCRWGGGEDPDFLVVLCVSTRMPNGIWLPHCETHGHQLVFIRHASACLAKLIDRVDGAKAPSGDLLEIASQGVRS